MPVTGVQTCALPIYLSELDYRSVYLAPEAYSLFALPYSVLQGEAGDGNNAPIRLEMTYNMIQ